MTAWGVIVIEAQRRKVAVEALTAASIDHFIPLVENLTISRGRHHRTVQPMFGRYGFFAINSGWEAVRALRGIAGMLMVPEARPMIEGRFDGSVSDEPRLVPALVDTVLLTELRSQCDGDVLRLCDKKPEVRPLTFGDHVRVVSGPLQRLIGIYYGKARKGKSDEAVFRLFGREQRLSFRPGELVAV